MKGGATYYDVKFLNFPLQLESKCGSNKINITLKVTCTQTDETISLFIHKTASENTGLAIFLGFNVWVTQRSNINNLSSYSNCHMAVKISFISNISLHTHFL